MSSKEVQLTDGSNNSVFPVSVFETLRTFTGYLDQILPYGLYQVTSNNQDEDHPLPAGTNGILLVLPCYNSSNTLQIFRRTGTQYTNDYPIHIRRISSTSLTTEWWTYLPKEKAVASTTISFTTNSYGYYAMSVAGEPLRFESNTAYQFCNITGAQDTSDNNTVLWFHDRSGSPIASTTITGTLYYLPN